MGLLQWIRQGLRKIFRWDRTKKAPAEKAPAKNVRDQVIQKYTPQSWGPTWTGETALKRKDQEWRVKQQRKSWKKFNENTGYNLTRREWENLFDDIGGAVQDFSEYMEGGSPTVVEMYMNYNKDIKNADPQDFINLVNAIKEGATMDQEELVTSIYNALDAFEYFQNHAADASMDVFLHIWQDFENPNDFKTIISTVEKSSPFYQGEDLLANVYNSLDVYKYFKNKVPKGSVNDYLEIWKEIEGRSWDMTPDELMERVKYEINRSF